MAKRNYQRLSIYEFGEHLLRSGDLDPVYIMLVDAELPEEQLKRWLISYWCYYHCGVASYLSEFEGKEFLDKLKMVADNKDPSPLGDRWPRGSERRHARGAQADQMIWGIRQKYRSNPEQMVDYIMEAAPDYKAVSDRTQEHILFGPWISFKVADMIDRVLGVEVDFNEAAVFMFKDPVKAALMLWRELQEMPENAVPKDQTAVIHAVVEHLKEKFKGFYAPPSHDRDIDLQEVETILCKWKSHMNGHYPLNNDIDEINEGLKEWAEHSATAKSLLYHLPRRLEEEQCKTQSLSEVACSDR